MYWFLKPKLFVERPFWEGAFVFWLLQWFMLIVIWAIYTNVRSPSREVLAAIDFFGVANLGFFFVYAEGDTSWSRRLGNLAGVYGALLLWNILIGTEIVNRSLTISWHWVWILPSETLSAFSLFLVGWVFFMPVRYFHFEASKAWLSKAAHWSLRAAAALAASVIATVLSQVLADRLKFK
jgi:hypothetical protein